MTFTPKTIALALIAGFFFIILLVQRSPSSSPVSIHQPAPPQRASAYETKEQSGGNVTVSVTPRNLTSKMLPQFDVTFDTHSVNLDFDVTASATLTDAQGNTLGQSTWDGTAPPSHHRSGTLTFSQPLKPNIQSLTLTLTDIARIPKREFTWKVTP